MRISHGFFFLLSFFLFFGGEAGGGGMVRRGVRWNNEPVNWLPDVTRRRKHPNPPSYFFLRFDFVHAKAHGSANSNQERMSSFSLAPTQLQPGNEEKVWKASLEGNMKMRGAVVLATKVFNITVVKFKSPGRNAAWRLVYFGGVRGDVSRAPSIKVFRSANIDRQNGCCELLKRYSVFIWCRWHGYSSQIGTF